jgi:stress response protein YsnF
MTSDPALPPVIGATADDRNGNALGTVTAVFVDDVTGRPTWVGLTDGPHASPDAGDVTLVAPITDAAFADGRLRLAVDDEAVRSSPRPSAPDRLSPAEEVTLREHYAAGTRGAAVGRTDTRSTEAAPQPAGRTGTGSGDTAMTRSEEQLRVETVREPWTRAVLRVETVTEEVMVPVTITRQQARIEYLPLRPGQGTTDAAGDAVPDAGDHAERSSDWVTLYADRPVVTLERAPVERVRLTTAWVSEQHAISDRLRREEIELTSDSPLR